MNLKGATTFARSKNINHLDDLVDRVNPAVQFFSTISLISCVHSIFRDRSTIF
jgi:hypothetical protein